MYKRQQQSISVKFDGLIIQEKNKCLENANEIKNSLNKVEQSTSNTNESYNGNIVLDKELTNDDDDVIESIISESTDEFVECDYEMLMCVNELEKEWKERVDECVGQRVNFPINFSEPRCSQMCLQGKSCLLYTSRCV